MQITSSASDAVLEFSQFEGESFQVSLRSATHSATKRVCCYTDSAGVAGLFKAAASEWRGWSGAKQWRSIEGELKLELTSDHSGHITLAVSIITDLGGPDSWRLQSELSLESGRLKGLAKEAKRFFQPSGEGGESAA